MRIFSTKKDTDLEPLQAKNAKLRRELRKARKQNEKMRSELKLIRAFVRDPDPSIEVPDSVAHVVAQVRAEKLSYLVPENLRSLAKLAIEADQSGREGLIIEAGSALGGSAIVLAAAKARDRPMRVYDAFGMIPPPSEKDPIEVHERYEIIKAGESKGVGGGVYYGYHEDLLAEVTASFARLGVEASTHHVDLIKGLFEDTVEIDEPVALAHLDGDWYDSTMVCLERIAPHLVTGGRIVLDDYYFWAGCRDAVHDYFANRSGFAIEHRERVHVVRT